MVLHCTPISLFASQRCEDQSAQSFIISHKLKLLPAAATPSGSTKMSRREFRIMPFSE
jgi:hypothetical protein